jgi:hypothetical protein
MLPRPRMISGPTDRIFTKTGCTLCPANSELETLLFTDHCRLDKIRQDNREQGLADPVVLI